MKRYLQLMFGAIVCMVAACAVISMSPPKDQAGQLVSGAPIWNRANATTTAAEPTYTVYVRPQGALSVTYPSTFTRKVWQPPTFYINSTDPQGRTELWEDSAGTATFEQIMTACPSLRPGIITQIAQQRANALGQSTSSNAGIALVYSENYSAAAAVVNGNGDMVLMKNGMTATAYCEGLGAQIGMTALQFANYVIQEANSMAPDAYRVEQEYLRLVYNVVPNSTSVSELLALPAAYVAFCNL